MQARWYGRWMQAAAFDDDKGPGGVSDTEAEQSATSLTKSSARERLLTRRRLMSLASAAGVVAGLSGCMPSRERTGRRRTPTPTDAVRGDVGLLVTAITGEELLLAYCAAVIDRHPELAAVVRPVHQRQREHVDVLRSALRRLDPPPAPRRFVVPAGRRSAQARLVRRIDAARRDRFDDCLAAESGPLARLLASAAASHAVTADLLRVQR